MRCPDTLARRQRSASLDVGRSRWAGGDATLPERRCLDAVAVDSVLEQVAELASGAHPSRGLRDVAEPLVERQEAFRYAFMGHAARAPFSVCGSKGTLPYAAHDPDQLAWVVAQEAFVALVSFQRKVGFVRARRPPLRPTAPSGRPQRAHEPASPSTCKRAGIAQPTLLCPRYPAQADRALQEKLQPFPKRPAGATFRSPKKEGRGEYRGEEAVVAIGA